MASFSQRPDVPGNVAQTKPHVVIAGEDLPASLVRQGELEGVDLTRSRSMPTKLPVGIGMRRMPLCERAPYAGELVVVAIRRRKQCLLGIISRKISVVQQELKLGVPVCTTREIAKYFVPAPCHLKPSSRRASRSKGGIRPVSGYASKLCRNSHSARRSVVANHARSWGPSSNADVARCRRRGPNRPTAGQIWLMSSLSP